VLNASDQAAASIAERPRVRRNDPAIRFFSATPGCGMLERHKRAGGICYEICDGQLTETEAGRQRVIMDVAELPGSFGGRARHVVANALAATAAGRAVGVPVKDIKAALAAFTPHQANPGRGNLYTIPGQDGAETPTPILVDYGHNTAALLATGELVASTWPGQPTAVVTLPGDRRDDLIAGAADAIATWFGAAVIYEDDDLRGRIPGEMRELIAKAMSKARPTMTIKHAHGPAEALHTAVNIAAGGPVLFIYENHAAAESALTAIGATASPEASPAAEPPTDLIDTLDIELAMDA